VTHGGGWFRGTYVTEEAWLLYPIFQNFEFVVISAEYRRTPEWRFPYYVEDSWDTLLEVPSKRTQEFGIDTSKIYLAGSSAGAKISAVLSQKARDNANPRIKISGAILNVPALCHPSHLPKDTKHPFTSYSECGGTLLSNGVMRQVWDIAIPNPEDGKSATVSPLLGDLRDLPPHLIFVAGQDPLRDEGIAYGGMLREAGVDVRLKVYVGVPQVFAEFWELESTGRFVGDLVEGVKKMLA
jgi:acetyl esterase